MTYDEMIDRLIRISCDLARSYKVHTANQLMEIKEELDLRKKQMAEANASGNQEQEIEKLHEIIAAQDVRIDQLRRELVIKKNAYKDKEFAEKKARAGRRGRIITMAVSATACMAFLILWLALKDNVYAWLSLSCAAFSLTTGIAAISFARVVHEYEEEIGFYK